MTDLSSIYKWYQPFYQCVSQGNSIPIHNNLVFETDEDTIYWADSVNPKLLKKTTDGGTTVTTITTRTNKDIARGYFDRTSNEIYFVDCEFDNTTSYVWKISLSDDSIMEITSKPCNIYDIWRYGNETFIMYFGTSGYTLETGNILPNEDITKQWTPLSDVDHYKNIDETSATLNTMDLNYTNVSDLIDSFKMSTIDMTGYDSAGVVDQVYQITVYYHIIAGTTSSKIIISGNKTGLTETICAATPYGWHSLTWSGLSLDQADLNDLQITLKSYIILSGIQLYAMYCKIDFYGDISNSILTIENLDTPMTDTEDMGTFAGRSWDISQVTTVGDQFWFLFKWSNENCELWRYDLSLATFLQMEDCGVNTELPTISRHAIAYDSNDILYFTLGTGTKEISTIVAQIANNIDDEDYIIYYAIQWDSQTRAYSQAKCYLWFDKAGDSVWTADPLDADVNIRIPITAGWTAQQVSDAIESAVNADGYITCDNAGGTTCTLTNDYCGACTNIVDGNSGLTVATTQAGVDCTWYLYSYTISTDTLTQITTYSIALMMDRFTDSTAKIPFNFEKAFDVSNDVDNRAKIYQISKKRANLYALAQINVGVGNTIQAITDTFIFLSNAWVYKWINAIEALSPQSYILARQKSYWEGHVWINTKYLDDEVTIFDGMFFQIIGNRTRYGNIDLISYYNSPDNFLDIDLTDDTWYFGLPDDFNLETIGAITVAGDMDFIDTLYLLGDTSCRLLESFDNHHHVLALSMGTGTANPYIIHDFAGGAEVTGTREFWVGTSDNTKETDYYFLESSPARILFKIDAGTFWYDNGGWVDTGITATNDTLFHIKITWDCTPDTYDLYISNVLIIAGAAFNTVAAGIDKFYFKLADDAEYTSYLNAWGDPADAGYVVGDNLVGRTVYGTLIDWVDIATLPNVCTCTIEADFDDHKNVLKLTHDGGADDPSIVHTIDTVEISGTWEWYWASSDITRTQRIIFRDASNNNCIILKIDASKYYYYALTVETEIVGDTPVNDTFDHFKIVFDCATDTFNLYINGTLRVNGGNFNVIGTSISNIYIDNSTNAAYSQYIGAPSDVADNDYYEGQNLVKTKEDQVIFEGYLHTSDLKPLRKCWIDSPSLFDLKHKLTAGSYGAARTDQNIVSMLVVDANYIVEGTMANGTAAITTIVKGNKALQTQLNSYGQLDGFTYVIIPDQGQGLLNYDDGTVDSLVNITEGEKISNVDGKKQRAIINQVTVKGAINPATGIPYQDTANDTASQKLYGVQPISRTFANLYSDVACLAQATAILTIQQLVPYTYTFQKKIGWEGLVLPHECITLSYSPDSMIASGQRIINSLEFYFRKGICKWEVQDAISYTTEMELLKQEVEELSDLIEQVALLGGGGMTELKDDLSPQLGGDLDLNGKNIDFPTTPNISDCLDEDNMASDSATKLATQQSIKAYVNTSVANIDPYIHPSSFFGSSGFIEEDYYGACFRVIFSDVNARIKANFYVTVGGSFKILIIHTGDGANAGKTASGTLGAGDVASGGADGWTDLNTVNADLPLGNAGIVNYYLHATAITIANNTKVGVQWEKDDNAGGAAGSMNVYTIILVRQ